MDTTTRLHTADDQPYNVSMHVQRRDVQRIGEALPSSVFVGATFTVEVATFNDLARIVAVLSPQAVAGLREALMADAAEISEALR